MLANPSSLLGRFAGERPAGPGWLREALAIEPERSSFDSDGTAIELLTWGEVGKPGLLFLHGNAAHADWWRFTAPFFANDFRCAALSWSGMGGSGWRKSYTIELFAREALGAIVAGKLDRANALPTLVGHSFGGLPLLHIAARASERIGAGILVDSAPPPRDRPVPSWVTSGASPPRYATLADALARYRFAPPQDAELPAIVDFLARGSLHHVPATNADPGGWTWRFDPALWTRLERTELTPLIALANVPMGLIRGERSALVTQQRIEDVARQLPRCRFVAAVPEAGHHIMVDQPLALIAALRLGLSVMATELTGTV